MKKTYSAPTLEDIRLACLPLLNISGGGQGNEGDDAESREWQGGFLWDDTKEYNVDLDY